MPSNTTAVYILVATLIGSLILSVVDAIRCHQCNSHLNEDCISLTLNTPRSGRDNQYLKECENEDEIGTGEYFCRKTVTFLEFNGKNRINRGCGWDRSDLPKNNKSCITADTQGIQQTVCTCFTDGCNSAKISFNHINLISYSLIGIFMIIIFQRNG